MYIVRALRDELLPAYLVNLIRKKVLWKFYVEIFMFDITLIRQSRVGLTQIQSTKPNGLVRVEIMRPAEKPLYSNLRVVIPFRLSNLYRLHGSGNTTP